MPLNSFQYNISSRINRSHNSQGRTFSHPLLGWIFLDLLAKVITAKYSPFLPINLSYDPSPWLAYGKPSAPWSNSATYPSGTYPAYKPPQPTYSNSYQTYPTLTTSAPAPHFQTKPSTSYASYDYNYPIPKKTANKDLHAETTKSDFYDDLVPAESNHHYQRRSSSGYKRKKDKRNRYSQQQKRRRTTTPSYYDSYEDYEPKPYHRRRKPYERESSESYEEYDESYETTKRPQKNKTKKRKQELSTEDASFVDFDDKVPTQTEIVIVRQAQSSSRPTSGTTSTTTEAGTTTSPAINTTTASDNSTTSYGYGPSNGNDGISITYGPPAGQYDRYGPPYVDWYNNPGNSVVKRIRDIVGFEHQFNDE